MEKLSELVARHAEQLGSKTAVSKWRPGGHFVETSYAELLRMAMRFAALFAQATPSGTIVPMLVGKTAESIAAMLGAVGTCRAFCFVNPKYRAPQITTVLDATASPVCVVDAAGLVALRGSWTDHPEIARVTWLVVGTAQLTGVSASAAEALRKAARVISSDEQFGGAQARVSVEHTVRPNTAATCLFTSGSTGEPKGVLISEEDLMRRVAAEIGWFGLTRADVLLSILPFSFDVGLNQLMATLAVGGELVLLDSWLPADILATTEMRRVTGISAVPAIWQEMIDTGLRFEKNGRHAALRYITVSGGSLSTTYEARLAQTAYGVGIFKTYGQTEAFRATSLRPEDYHRKPGTVGRPFPGVRVYVVNEDGSCCRPGEAGEIVHAGLGTMMGYLGSTGGKTEINKKLRKNPFYGSDDPSPLAIFTGDTGYLDEEGYLCLKGRCDDMLKVMGNRVYPQEITNQIVAIPGVREALVAGVTREEEQTVIAFVAVAHGVELSAGGIRRILREKLPAFMIPREIVVMQQLPRTPHGKPDGHRLLEEYAADRTSTAALRQ